MEKRQKASKIYSSYVLYIFKKHGAYEKMKKKTINDILDFFAIGLIGHLVIEAIKYVEKQDRTPKQNITYRQPIIELVEGKDYKILE